MSDDTRNEGHTPAGDGPPRRGTYREPGSPDVVETQGEPVVVNSDERPVIVEPTSPEGRQDATSGDPAQHESGTAETPQPIVTEHAVADVPPVDADSRTGDDLGATPVHGSHAVSAEPEASSEQPVAHPDADDAATTRLPASPPVAEPEQHRIDDADSTDTAATTAMPTPVAPPVAATAATAGAATAAGGRDDGERAADDTRASEPTAAPARAVEARAADTHPAEHRAVYVEAPTPPKKKSNRGFGALITVLATLVFALLWAAVAAVVIALASTAGEFADSLTNFLLSAAFFTPVAVFFVAFLLLVLLLNRAGWGWYILGGFLVAVLVYLGYLGGALITVAPRITPAEVDPFVRSIALTPLAIGAGLVAREVSIWAGAVIAGRGRKVKARNLAAQDDYEREVADRRAEYERARSGSAS